MKYCPKKYEMEFLPRITEEMSLALDKELQNFENADVRTHIPDFFDCVRRCIMRAFLNGLVGSCILESSNSMLLEMRVFQDKIEDATAKGAFLPRYMSVPLVLQPVATARKSMQKKHIDCLALERERRAQSRTNATTEDIRHWGPWLRSFENYNAPLEERSEFIIGLIIAAHKTRLVQHSHSPFFWQKETRKMLSQAKLKPMHCLEIVQFLFTSCGSRLQFTTSRRNRSV
jgi:hypothetical protein